MPDFKHIFLVYAFCGLVTILLEHLLGEVKAKEYDFWFIFEKFMSGGGLGVIMFILMKAFLK